MFYNGHIGYQGDMTMKRPRSDKGSVHSPLRQQTIDLYQNGKSNQEIADLLGISVAGVVYHLNRAGIYRPRTKKLHAEDLPRAIELYQSGWSLSAVAREFDMTDECLRRRLDQAGIARRSLKESVPRGPGHRHYKDGKAKENEKIRESISRKESWQVAAICLGHPLAKGWVVHHMDENPANNDPDNLWLFAKIDDHARYHAQLTDFRQRGIEVDTTRLALENDGLKLPPPNAPIAFVRDTDPLALFDTLRTQLQDRTTS
jgi:transposase-like protein